MSTNQLDRKEMNPCDFNEKLGICNYISEENIKRLKSIMYPKKFTAHTYLFWDGDQSEYVYYVLSGKVKLIKSTEEGKDMIMSIYAEHDLIIEMDGFAITTHQFSAVVLEDAEIGVIQRKDLDIILQRHGDFALEFMSYMGLIHRVTQSKMRDLLMYGKTGALSSTLIRMCNSFGVACVDGIRIDLKLTNTELAEIIGATRESVNRILAEWKDDGTITVKNGQIIVQRLSQLKSNCNCPSYPICPVEICRM